MESKYHEEIIRREVQKLLAQGYKLLPNTILREIRYRPDAILSNKTETVIFEAVVSSDGADKSSPYLNTVINNAVCYARQLFIQSWITSADRKWSPFHFMAVLLKRTHPRSESTYWNLASYFGRGIGRGLAFFIERHEQKVREIEAQPELDIIFEVVQTPDKYRSELIQLHDTQHNVLSIRRKFWRACVTNSGGFAERCKATVKIIRWSPDGVRHSPQGDTQVVWETGQPYQDIGAKLGKEFVHIVFSDERADSMEGDYKAFISTEDGIRYWYLPLRAQDALGRGQFDVELTVTSIKGASVSKQFRINTALNWRDLTMEMIR